MQTKTVTLPNNKNWFKMIKTVSKSQHFTSYFI